MFGNDLEIERLIRIAKMYYDDGLTQNEIAKEINVSRPLVSKMLTKARDMGIVTITIRSPLQNNDLIAARLATAYGIMGAIVVPEAKNDYMTEQLILAQAAKLLEDRLLQSTRIGLGWGFLMESFVNQLPETTRPIGRPGQVCPMIGGSTVPNKGYNPNEIVRVFSEKTGLAPHYVFAPAFPLTRADRDQFTNTQNFTTLERLWSTLDMAVLRISNYPSSPDHATASRFGKKLSQMRAVGILLSFYYDAEGRFITSENDNCISIGLDMLEKTPVTIGICSSNSSIPSIVGALKTGMITHVVLDEGKALKVIAEAEGHDRIYLTHK